MIDACESLILVNPNKHWAIFSRFVRFDKAHAHTYDISTSFWSICVIFTIDGLCFFFHGGTTTLEIKRGYLLTRARWKSWMHQIRGQPQDKRVSLLSVCEDFHSRSPALAGGNSSSLDSHEFHLGLMRFPREILGRWWDSWVVDETLPAYCYLLNRTWTVVGSIPTSVSYT